MEAAALLEPLSVAIHATNRATVEPGDTVLVFGAGAVGLLTAAMAKVCGATNVVIADIDLGRVRFALQHQFATRGFVVPLPKEANTVEERIAAAKYISDEALRIAFSKRGNTMDVDLTDPLLGADVVFDCTGKEICVQAGLFVSTSGNFNLSRLTIPGGTPWRPVGHGWYGHADPDASTVSSAFEGSGYHRHFQVLQHIQERAANSFVWNPTESRQHGDAPISWVEQDSRRNGDGKSNS